MRKIMIFLLLYFLHKGNKFYTGFRFGFKDYRIALVQTNKIVFIDLTIRVSKS